MRDGYYIDNIICHIIIIIILLTTINGGEYIKLGNVIIILCSDYNMVKWPLNMYIYISTKWQFGMA